MPSEVNASIPVELQIEILISLRILSREQYGISELTSNSSIKKLLAFTGLNSDVKLTLSQIMDDNSGLALKGETKGIHTDHTYSRHMYISCQHVCYVSRVRTESDLIT